LLKNIIGSQAEKLKEIPDSLDEVVTLIDTDHGGTVESPRVIEKTITFELPAGWEKQMNRELKRAKRNQLRESGNAGTNGCLAFVVGVFIIWILILIF